MFIEFPYFSQTLRSADKSSAEWIEQKFFLLVGHIVLCRPFTSFRQSYNIEKKIIYSRALSCKSFTESDNEKLLRKESLDNLIGINQSLDLISRIEAVMLREPNLKIQLSLKLITPHLTFSLVLFDCSNHYANLSKPDSQINCYTKQPIVFVNDYNNLFLIYLDSHITFQYEQEQIKVSSCALLHKILGFLRLSTIKKCPHMLQSDTRELR